MSNTRFLEKSRRYLELIFEKIESRYPDIDIELGLDNLTIITKDDKTFLVTINQSAQQLWFSSPLSGAHHFFYSDLNWISTRDQTQNIDSILTQELNDIMLINS